jgi:phytoene synthase
MPTGVTIPDSSQTVKTMAAYRQVTPAPCAEDWSRCAQVTRAHGRTFAFASELLPPDRKRAIHAVYAFCRHADDLIDRHIRGGPVAALAALAGWRSELTEPNDPIAIAFAATRVTFGIPDEPVLELFDGLASDVADVRYATWADLDVYCYRVAGTVGLMTAPILGCNRHSALPQAVALGKAMQLTNILRDIAEDAVNGRIYLPLDELERFGVSASAVLQRKPDGDYRGLIDFQVARARGLYAEGLSGVGALHPSGRLAAIAGAHLYGKILDRIERREFDGFRERASISTAEKFKQLPAMAILMLRHSGPWADVSR